MTDVRSTELARFLKSRRDRVRPADAGLPTSPRRRVPGLRREEVAVLANIGTTWYTWLEQGRHVRPSSAVLESIAEALQLSQHERAHLFRLGGYPERACSPGLSAVDARLQAMLADLMPQPAMVHDPRFHVLAFNPCYRYLIADVEEIPAAERTCAIQTFENPDWIRAFARTSEHAPTLVAKLRAFYGETLEDPEWTPMLERLIRHPQFRSHWESGNVTREAGQIKTIDNPYVGELKLQVLNLIAQENRRLNLSVYQPADATSRSRLETLAGLISTGQIEGRRRGGSVTALRPLTGGHGSAAGTR